jgi:hypothetical protein
MSLQEPKKIIQGSWLSPKLCKEIWMVNSQTKMTCNAKLKMKTPKTESSNPAFTKESRDNVK